MLNLSIVWYKGTNLIGNRMLLDYIVNQMVIISSLHISSIDLLLYLILIILLIFQLGLLLLYLILLLPYNAFILSFLILTLSFLVHHLISVSLILSSRFTSPYTACCNSNYNHKSCNYSNHNSCNGTPGKFIFDLLF